MTYISGAKGKKPKKQAPPVEAPNSLRNVSRGRILDLVGHGPIYGLAEGHKSVFLDGTPLQNSDNSYNFSGVRVTTREGYPDQTPIAGFRSVENPVTVNTAVTFSTPIVRAVSNNDADAVVLLVQVSSLNQREETTGNVNPTSVTLKVETKNGNASWTRRLTNTISGKTTSAYQRSFRVALDGEGPWQVRVSRTTPDAKNSSTQNATSWVSMTEVVDARLNYPDSALIGIEVDAQLFGNQMPSRAYDLKMSIIKVPSNYDPITRVYTGIWDGTFKLAWTDNPAWCYYDLATHPTIGANLDGVDKWSLYQIGKYCDELVPDGYGGMEPRFTLNTVFTDRTEAITTLSSLASVFRGMTYWGTNTVVPVADMPSDPVKLVTPANVVDGEFTYAGTALKERHSVAVVMWNDPEDQHKAKPEFVEDPESLDLYGWREVHVTALGATSRGQAHRLGRWILHSERLVTQSVTYSAVADHADLRPGDVIQVADPDMAGARMGGRIAVTGTVTLTLDKAPPAEVIAGHKWYLSTILKDGSVARAEVTLFSGNEVTLKTALPSAPLVEAMWILSSMALAMPLFRVSSVSEKEDGSLYTISATEYDPSLYALVEQGLTLPVPQTNQLPTGPIPPPLAMSTAEYLYRAGVAVRSGLAISVQSALDPRIAYNEVQVLPPGQLDYHGVPPAANGFDVPDTIPGQYGIRARSVSSVGQRSAWLEMSETVQGMLQPPTSVTDLTITLNAGQAILSWPPVPDLDLSHYLVRFTSDTDTPSWGASQPVVDRVAAGTTSLSTPARKGAYLVKSVDTSGGECVTAAIVTSNVTEILNSNVVELIDAAPDWSGDKSFTVGNPNGLQLADSAPIAQWLSMSPITTLSFGLNGVTGAGYYEASKVVDLGEAYPCRITGDLVVGGRDLLGVISSWTTLALTSRLDMSEMVQWGVVLEIATCGMDGVWTPWASFSMGEYTARKFKFRVSLRSDSPSVTPTVSSLKVVIDVPDRVDGGSDIVCPAEGVRVQFTPPFMVKPSLAVDSQGLAEGDRRLMTNVSEEGFTIQFLNKTGAPVARTFDYIAKGYGRRAV